MYKDEVKLKIEAELALAVKYREQGFEGRARVCSRRAAGIAIRAYLQRILPVPPEMSLNVNELFLLLSNLSDELPEIQLAVSHLSTRVNEEFQLPPAIDLLAEARWLAITLENLT